MKAWPGGGGVQGSGAGGLRNYERGPLPSRCIKLICHNFFLLFFKNYFLRLLFSERISTDGLFLIFCVNSSRFSSTALSSTTASPT